MAANLLDSPKRSEHLVTVLVGQHLLGERQYRELASVYLRLAAVDLHESAEALHEAAEALREAAESLRDARDFAVRALLLVVYAPYLDRST